MNESLAKMLNIDLTDPEQIAAIRQVQEEYARSINFECAFGCCSWNYDPVEKIVHSGFGPVGCLCDEFEGDGLRLWREMEK